MLSQRAAKKKFIVSEADGWDSRPYQKTRLAKHLADESKMKTTVRAHDGCRLPGCVRPRHGRHGHSSRRPDSGC